MKLIHPLKYVTITQGFGEVNTSPELLPKYQAIGLKGHNGLDYYAVDGTDVMASHDGTVTYAGLDGSNGNLIVIMTDTQFDYQGQQAYYKSLYGHLKTGTFKVTAGDKVKAGQVIAQADNTGMSFGSHLHFGLKPVRKGEQSWEWFNITQNDGYNGAIDPTEYLPKVNYFQTKLKLGNTGFEVEKVQAFLIRNGYMAPVPKLGFYGSLTARAILSFQIKNIPNLSWYEKNILKGSRIEDKTLIALNKLI